MNVGRGSEMDSFVVCLIYIMILFAFGASTSLIGIRPSEL